MGEDDINPSYTKEDAYKTLEVVNTWINNIDTKVSYALALVGALSALIFSLNFKGINHILELEKLNMWNIIESVLVIALYILVFISILCFLLAIIARVKNESNNKSIFFFGTIASMGLSEYKEKINKMNEKNIIEDLQEQIHINSRICSRKIKFYNLGIKFFIIGIILWFVCMSFKLL